MGGSRAALTDAGVLVVARGACIARWESGHWASERFGDPSFAQHDALTMVGGNVLSILVADDGSATTARAGMPAPFPAGRTARSVGPCSSER